MSKTIFSNHLKREERDFIQTAEKINSTVLLRLSNQDNINQLIRSKDKAKNFRDYPKMKADLKRLLKMKLFLKDTLYKSGEFQKMFQDLELGYKQKCETMMLQNIEQTIAQQKFIYKAES